MEQFHKNLDVWKVSTELVLDIYTLIKTFPTIEQYSLSDQMRRAAISIPSNIAEWCARNTHKEKIHFLYIARGSCAELDTQVYLAKQLNYLTEEQYTCITLKMTRIWQMLSRFINASKQQNENP